MEIKVICECGTKYKFEVEPVNGHMPQPVKCPSCGANGTTSANAAIREALGIAPPAIEAVPVAPVVAAAPTISTPPPQVRLSVSRPAATPAAEEPTPQHYPGAVSLGGIPARGAAAEGSSSVWGDRGKKALQLAWKGVLILLCIGAMLMGFGGKKGKRVRFLAKITSAIMKSDAKEDWEDYEPNFWGEDMVLLLIRHTNETEVAEVCASFWQDNYKKKVTFVLTNDLEGLAMDEHQISIIPAHRGCVQIVGDLKWPEEDFEKLTQLLSQKLNTVAVEMRDVDFSGAYVFGVFENGEKKFRAEMKLKGKTLADAEESVTVEGEDWARAHGYKPGKEGFNEFHLWDGDRITRQLGFNITGHEWEHYLVMNQISSPSPAKPSVVPVRTGKAR